MKSGGLRGIYLSTNPAFGGTGDEASIMFPNPPFVIAFVELNSANADYFLVQR
jgi:hypothetical protein